jgi:serine/alanine adding enzyme
MYKIVHDQDIDREKWTRFVAENPHGSIFHTPEMYDVFLKTKHYDPHPFAALDESGEIQALLSPVVISLYSTPVLSRFSARAVDYGGPVYSETDSGKAAMKTLLTEYLRKIGKQAIFSEFRNLSDVGSIHGALDESGFRFESHVNYWIELDAPYEEILLRATQDARKAVRRAFKRGLRVYETKDPEFVPLFCHFLKETYQRKRVPFPDFSLFQNCFDILVPQKYATFFAAEAEGRVVGGLLALLYNEVIYLFYFGDDVRMRHYNIMDGFMGYTIQWGLERGFKIIDFGWAGKKNEAYGVRNFKAKFGGREILFGRHVFIHRPKILRLSVMGYKLIRGIRGGHHREVHSDQEPTDSIK